MGEDGSFSRALPFLITVAYRRVPLLECFDGCEINAHVKLHYTRHTLEPDDRRPGSLSFMHCKPTNSG